MSMGAIFSAWENSMKFQMPFCQTAPLLPSVAWQQHTTEHQWEGFMSTATSHKHTFGKSYDVLSGPSVCSELYPQTPITDAQYF